MNRRKLEREDFALEELGIARSGSDAICYQPRSNSQPLSHAHELEGSHIIFLVLVIAGYGFIAAGSRVQPIPAALGPVLINPVL